MSLRLSGPARLGLSVVFVALLFAAAFAVGKVTASSSGGTAVPLVLRLTGETSAVVRAPGAVASLPAERYPPPVIHTTTAAQTQQAATQTQQAPTETQSVAPQQTQQATQAPPAQSVSPPAATQTGTTVVIQ